MNIEPPTTQCKYCPFRSDGGIKLSQAKTEEIYRYLLQGVNHLCHLVVTRNQVCWGGRQWQLEVFYRLGYIGSPTNKALAEAMRRSGVEPGKHIECR